MFHGGTIDASFQATLLIWSTAYHGRLKLMSEGAYLQNCK